MARLEAVPFQSFRRRERFSAASFKALDFTIELPT